ncbi:MAG: DUF4174 domain-containing protein [Cyanomargarita calcarea GSE-NOS-MK-12-04C]|jgi:hypothetical protein|uniref:DUF4174 domain-containing protein n=1 Tax=Cyanomargarita calcarea GSE-NOS-MK-12-04C TaxID=2839659 RepID=A0A951QXU5_9CYAN|nr:DUF4174 domain-containing protein [Cyanomargarita calcarea GSE-NOS-MK-12-04C]
MSKFLFIIPLLTSLVFLPVSQAATPQATTNRTVKMSSFNLSSQKWKNRVLLVFAPSSDNSAYQEQMQIFSEEKAAFLDRDLVLVQVLATGESYANGQKIDENSAVELRDRFDVSKNNFRVILVGKDGGAKRQDTVPVKAKAIFNEIDAMPMRQEEMRLKK